MLNRIKRFLFGGKRPVKEEFRVQLSRVPHDIKLIVGAGSYTYDGWIASEKRQLDILQEEDWNCLFNKRKIANILAEHVWEHFSLADAEIANALCYKYLAPGGKLRLAVPDGFFPDQGYIDYVKPGGTGPGADDHKVLYNYQLMREELERIGFNVELLEYWDEQGMFHCQDWDPGRDGMIRRSKRFDQRNENGALKYTSLIVDAIKP